MLKYLCQSHFIWSIYLFIVCWHNSRWLWGLNSLSCRVDRRYIMPSSIVRRLSFRSGCHTLVCRLRWCRFFACFLSSLARLPSFQWIVTINNGNKQFTIYDIIHKSSSKKPRQKGSLETFVSYESLKAWKRRHQDNTYSLSDIYH